MVRLLSSKPPVRFTCGIRSKKGAILMASAGKKDCWKERLLERKITDYAAYGVAAGSITSSNVRSPVRGVLTSTAMLPGGCRLVGINSCGCGFLVEGNT